MVIEMEKWSEEMATGVIWQDMQHAELVKQINALHDAIVSRKDKKHIKKIFHFLDRYIVDHFAIEEKYMKVYDFPEKVKHLKEHKKFAKNYRFLKKHCCDSEEYSVSSLCFDLNQWIIKHIKKKDKKLGQFLRSKI